MNDNIKEFITNINQVNKVEIKAKLEELKKREAEIKEDLINLGRKYDYIGYKEKGFSQEQIFRFSEEDDSILEKIKQFRNKINNRKPYLFGYPSNNYEDTTIIKTLREIECDFPLNNNCGDTYDKGNYDLDNKEIEIEILKELFKQVGLDDNEGWGYITSGGSESNRWGIENGYRELPTGISYCSTAAHYSIDKVLNLLDKEGKKHPKIDSEVIKTKTGTDQIDVDELKNRIKLNWEKNQRPAILILTWGTTKRGACDNIEEIFNMIKEFKAKEPNLKFYIHLDAALLGGIPKNQNDAPLLPNIKKYEINSVSISLHKYFGHNEAKSALIALKKPQNPNCVDYIGQLDSTTSGSRSLNAFSAYQRIIEVLKRSPSTDYIKNIQYLQQKLDEKGIEYEREEKSNFFVINAPSRAICEKYQLAVFHSGDKDKAHLIIFPYHSEKVIDEFISDLLNS